MEPVEKAEHHSVLSRVWQQCGQIPGRNWVGAVVVVVVVAVAVAVAVSMAVVLSRVGVFAAACAFMLPRGQHSRAMS